MEERKIKFEVSRLGVVFIVLFALCLLVWTFILGVWIGTKIGEKPTTETAKEESLQLAQKPKSEMISQPPTQNQTKEQAKEVANETITSTSNQTALTKTKPEEERSKSEELKPKSEAAKPKPRAEEVKTQSKSKVSVPEETKTKKKEVVMVTKEKKPSQETGFYALQVGAFSKRDSADKIKEDVEKLGLKALVKEVKQEGKMVYKVLAGRFETREKAQEYIEKIESKLGIKPFVVEVQ